MIERIARAAIRVDGVVWTVPRPGRHHDVIQRIIRESHHERVGADHFQGFITDEWRFVDRRDACRIAIAADQILEKTGPADELFSEDVW